MSLTPILLLVLLLPTAQAVYYRPPQSIGVAMVASTSYGGETNQFDGTANVSFELSPDDPDQINGSLRYEEHIYGEGAGFSPFRFNHTPGVNLYPVPNRPGWVYFTRQIAAANVENATYRFNFSVWDTTPTPDEEGASSCDVSVDFREDEPANVRGLVMSEGAWQDQCGENIQHVPGVAALVTTAATDNTSGAVNVSWKLSPSDVNNTTGAFNYTVFTIVDDQGDPFLYRFEVDSATVAENAGTRWFAYDVFTLSRITNYVLVYDNMTHRLNSSCVYIDNGSTVSRGAGIVSDVLFSSAVCGNMPALAPSLNMGGPQFPLINVANTAAAMDLSESTLGLLLAAALLMSLALGGGWIAGPVGAAIGSLAGVALASVLNLIPIWVLVLCVLFGAVAVVLLARGGRE